MSNRTGDIIFSTTNKLPDCHDNTVSSLSIIPVLINIIIIYIINIIITIIIINIIIIIINRFWATVAVVVVVKRTRSRAIPLAMITMRKAKKLITYVTLSFQAE